MDGEQPTFNPVAGINFTGPEVEEGEMVMDAVLIVRVQSLDSGKSRITSYRSVGMDDVTETGMITIHAHRDLSYWTHQAVVGDDND